jgi:hypothetical protein
VDALQIRQLGSAHLRNGLHGSPHQCKRILNTDVREYTYATGNGCNYPLENEQTFFPNMSL